MAGQHRGTVAHNATAAPCLPPRLRRRLERDREVERRPATREMVARGVLPETLALEDGAAAHFVGSKLLRIVTSRPNVGAYRVRREGRQFVETPLVTVHLNKR